MIQQKKTRCLLYVLTPTNVIAAICAVKQLHINADVSLTIYVDANGYGFNEKINQNIYQIIKQITSQYSFVEQVKNLQGNTVRSAQSCVSQEEAASYWKKEIDNQEYQEIYYAHDCTGKFYFFLCRIFPHARKICYGDALGIVYDRKTHLQYSGVKADTILEPVKAHKAVLILPVDYYGNFLDHVPLVVCKKELFFEVINDCKSRAVELRLYITHILDTYRGRDRLLLITENCAEGDYLSIDQEIKMLCSIIKSNIDPGGVVIIKSHPGASISRAEMVEKRLGNKYTIVKTDEIFNVYPIEMWEDLVKNCKIVSISYTGISLKYLYGIDVIQPMNEEFIERWFREEKWPRLKTVFYYFEEIKKRLAMWDGNSLLFSGQVIETYNNPFPKKIKKVIRSLIRHKKIIISGRGSHTYLLLKMFPLLKERVIAISSVVKNEENFLGIPIIAESELQNKEYDFILVSSKSFEVEIFNRLIKRGIPDHKIQLLYSSKKRSFKIINLLLKKIKAIIDRKINNPKSSWDIYRDYIKIHPTAIIDPAASVKIVNPPDPPQVCLEIGEGSHIFSSFSLFRPQSKIKIGKNCQLGNVHFMAADSIEVGDDVLMAWGITIMDTDNHSIYWEERRFDVERCKKDYKESNGQDIVRSHDWSGVGIKKVVIGNKVWIGFNTIILKGVTIGEGAIIGAGSVVTKDIKPWHVAAGNPCRHIKPIAKGRWEKNA